MLRPEDIVLTACEVLARKIRNLQARCRSAAASLPPSCSTCLGARALTGDGWGLNGWETCSPRCSLLPNCSLQHSLAAMPAARAAMVWI